ncbi:hypothetical protein ALMP_69120 [Streptomyces sp. A012304]|nr:hypothetical protein ALMP_69120 [Streptomyces sp. A012304]
MPSASSALGIRNTSLPTCLACDMNRNASGARRTSNDRTGTGSNAPETNNGISTANNSAIPSAPAASIRSNA